MESKVTHRVFKRYIQRFFYHESHLGYKYLSTELSSHCPRGLSGAPLFNKKFHARLYGIVTENIKLISEIETVVDVKEGKEHYREQSYSVINYGVCLWLNSVSAWIDAIVKPLSNEEINRRTSNQRIKNIENWEPPSE